MIIYCFDIKIKNLKAYNTLKRRFYYNLNKLEVNFLSKSVIVCREDKEKEFDKFFSYFKDYLELYKIKSTKIKKIY
jgi:hypothetical protein